MCYLRIPINIHIKVPVNTATPVIVLHELIFLHLFSVAIYALINVMKQNFS